MGTSICKPVYNLQFSSHGQTALNRVRKQMSLYKVGAALMMSGTFHTMLTKSSPTQIGYNIISSDWEILAKAVGDWPTSIRNIIAKEAAQMELNTVGVESEFWGGLSACLKY